MEGVVKANCAALSAKASLTPSIIRQALNRDRRCLFSGAVPSCDSDALVATWIFPPFLGHKLSNDKELEARYYRDPEACDLSELMVVANVISGLKGIVALFWENKLGIDVDDNYRIIVFEGPERLNTLQSHLTLVDGSDRPSDCFLRLHFKECLAVSACRGDVLEDYQDQEIESFMEELGIYDGEIDGSDPKWTTPLGVLVNAYLIRQKIAQI
ncbi:hypothetical protein M378DRAFT_1009943 [Amanita muscaria Koide BX008]|uniref:HNH nuclease domain-containing protein n=1 Tax=Amanita muscaria (strain Koide BX008) TaxID=946122 RepID=A0A0C2S9C3_AMAMK|nr:hypothetical protein M378DRAFT_1009943 [Amanita muscaria Koide BX008]